MDRWSRFFLSEHRSHTHYTKHKPQNVTFRIDEISNLHVEHFFSHPISISAWCVCFIRSSVWDTREILYETSKGRSTFSELENLCSCHVSSDRRCCSVSPLLLWWFCLKFHACLMISLRRQREKSIEQEKYQPCVVDRDAQDTLYTRYRWMGRRSKIIMRIFSLVFFSPPFLHWLHLSAPNS